jgi:DNA adenine methylase
MRYITPLRYPGGKQRLGKFFAEVVRRNGLSGGAYYEPFCGGAGVGLYLLVNGIVSSIHINDIDRSIYAFWYAVTKHTERLCELISRIPVNVREWDKQREVQRHKGTAKLFDLGFSTLFLNRTNRSGILRAGMVGGRAQTGRWKLDARFNRDALIERVRTIGRLAARIQVTQEDAESLIHRGRKAFPKESLIYLDPPYVLKSADLYLSKYKHQNHADLARAVKTLRSPWIITYDDCPLVRELYSGERKRVYRLSYSADTFRYGSEVLIASPNLRVPAYSDSESAPSNGKVNWRFPR